MKSTEQKKSPSRAFFLTKKKIISLKFVFHFAFQKNLGPQKKMPSFPKPPRPKPPPLKPQLLEKWNQKKNSGSPYDFTGFLKKNFPPFTRKKN